MTPLIVYKASAGSGKTFRLAVEYIKLLVQNPMSYRTTLAVTFTNKATEEMKMRILSQLYGIWKQLPDSRPYLERVCEELGIDEEKASRQSGVALSNLIHNYSHFRVETIDSFFQSVLRNLARELDLTTNLRVGLNDSDVEEMAVDRLIESLQSSDRILMWIMSFITANISDDKSWNVIGQIKKFGKTIFKDFYKAESARLNGIINKEGFFDDYIQELKTLRQQADDTMKGFADSFYHTLEENGLSPDQLRNKQKGISSYFKKLCGSEWSDAKCLTANLASCLESAESWTTKTSPDREHIIAVAEDKLINLLREAENRRPRMWRVRQSAELTLRHLTELRLLNSIEDEVAELNDEANRFLLSNTQQLLYDLIDNSDSPFVFEKIGAQLEHIMIDEFQDTSTVQWKNFKVLLQEAMSRSGGNLIVGDVKQSIYRWRSGDWRLLNDIENEFHAGQLSIRKLDFNRRSEYNIIDFNNAFFVEAAKLEYLGEQEKSPDHASQLSKAYEDVEQRKPDGKTPAGLVDVTLLPAEDYQEKTLMLTAGYIETLMAEGVPANKIAILVRANKYIPLICNYFMERMPEVGLVSDEAFRLEFSTSVTILTQAMRLLIHPDDMLISANLVKLYQRQVVGCDEDDNYLFADLERLNDLLPEAYVKDVGHLAQMPLLELAESLYDIFGLAVLERESAYVCTFFDCISNFVQENTADLTSFITEFDETLFKKTIQSDEIDGIRLISIHKSKGLEFDNVVIPFCDWRLEMTDTTIWCTPQEEPFSRLPLVPVDYSGRMLDTIYADDYREEHLQNTVDNLNLLYVAFTRAVKNLFVIGRRNMPGYRSAIIEQVLPLLTDQLTGSMLEGTEDAEAPMHFMFGTLRLSDTDKEKKTDNVFLQPVTQKKIRIETFPNPVEFMQSNRSRDFIHGTDEEPTQQQTYIKMGNILHNLFSSIRTTADIPQVLRQLELDGVLYDDDISAERLRTMLEKRLTNPKVADWFSDRWQLFNECSILHVDPVSGQVVERRPDRVMTDGKEMIVVDFKFGRPYEEHHWQVSQYKQLLEGMGHQNVQGYLWYVYSNQIVTV